MAWHGTNRAMVHLVTQGGVGRGVAGVTCRVCMRDAQAISSRLTPAMEYACVVPKPLAAG